jgi:hypothetical protein
LFFRVLLFLASAVGFVCPQLNARVLQVPASYATIQSAINAAVTGDTVLVAIGTYFENIDFRGKRITVASQFLINRVPDMILQTKIDGSRPTSADSGSVARFISHEDSLAVLCGFTLQNGIGTLVPGSFAGGGILVANNSGPRICWNVIRSNSALVGAGIAIKFSKPIIENNAIIHNFALDGGAIWIDNSEARINHDVIYSNDAEGLGGAIFMRNSSVTLTNSSVTNNSSTTCGGVYCSGGNCQINNCNFYHNQTKNFLGCGEPAVGDVSKAKNYNLDSADVFANIMKDPGYTNISLNDFHLRCDSRLIDAGTAIPPTYPTGGAREDIGMFEYQYRTGDPTADGRVNLADATTLINIIFLGTPIGCPLYASDCDCNRRISITDVVALINYWSGYHSIPGCLFTPTVLR